MSSSPTRPSVERIRRAAQVDEAIVLVSRASYDQRLCKRLLEGHKRVLEAERLVEVASRDRAEAEDARRLHPPFHQKSEEEEATKSRRIGKGRQ